MLKMRTMRLKNVKNENNKAENVKNKTMRLKNVKNENNEAEKC